MHKMKETKELILGEKTYILSKFTAIAGREIVAKYPLSNLPKLGEYSVSEDVMVKLMSFVSVVLVNGNIQKLNTKALIDNHVENWEDLAKIEMAMLEFNCSFFQNGRISNFFQDFAQKLPTLISKILMDSLGQLSPTEKPLSTN